jgi:hypothetical protein
MTTCYTSSSVTSETLVDMFPPRPIADLKVLQVVFVHFVYNFALFFASCCCSFFLHFVANFICIFLVSRQLVLHSAVPKFLLSSCGKKYCSRLFFWKVSWRLISIIFFNFLSVQISFPYKKWGKPVHYICLFLKMFGPKLIYECCLEFPVFDKILLVFVEYF